ncbi:zinc-ribbon domain-containing protein [Butyrivibrio sp. INlla18]|uniref:zinc ribbon domain-containing protein n=1 Tax=Butyrivibrio sp. INlla18 TaxID=1520806 RepID=UPI00087FC87F|nr:zinc ribbon domain-containing protein [Butyrivibrio sp. INlla18]SDA62544.1 zinc-ribbon domain-containing protein [Butyrivibrio sp. INlla18]
MKCKSCGATVNSGAMFCAKCGAKIDEPQKTGLKINSEQIKEFSSVLTQKGGEVIKKSGAVISEKAVEVKDKALETKEDITNKLTELDRMLESSITEYNDAYTLMNDKGMQLYVERCRSVDSINNIEILINSIANHPKSFDTDFEEINTNRKEFTDACEFAEKEISAARNAAGGAGAGLAAGASVAFMAPTAAMWIATTFGTASTGTAISTLSGAAATNAALAWLGGGTLAEGAAGIAGGQALLALAGPVGWTIAGATLLTSILLFTKNKAKLNKEKNEEIEAVKRNTEAVKEMDGEIYEILTQTNEIRKSLNTSFQECLSLFNCDYTTVSDDDKNRLGALVNLTKSLSALYGKQVTTEGSKT